MALFSLTDATRLWSKVDQSGGPWACWPFLGSRNSDGYGKIWVGGRKVRAHRLIWELTRGPIPPGLCVCHRCDNPSCVHPAHLFLDTIAGNNEDMMAKGRHRTADRRGERSGKAKLTETAVLEIHRLGASGLSQRALARRFGVGKANIQHILARRTWAHVREDA